MRLHDSFRIDRPPAEVFDAFLDIERVATCLPGSKVLGRSGDDTYDGEVRVKVGPLAVAYTGRLRVLEADRERLRLTLRAKGRERSGAGNADAHVVASLSEADGATVVDIDTDLSVRGRVAQFGRGVIADVSAGIMRTFAANVEQMLQRGEEPAAAREQPAPVDDDGLDAWAVVVRPLLVEHAGSVATVVCAGLAAYVGARLGSARARRRAFALGYDTARRR